MDLPSLSIPTLSELMDRLPLGVVVLEASGRVVLYNRYEEILAARKRSNVLGRSFFTEIAPCMNVRELGGLFHRDIGREAIDVELEFAFPLPFLEQPRDVVVRMVSFESDSEAYGALFIEDVSARRAVERMKEALGRLLVHDMKNPLSVMVSNLKLLGADDLSQSDRTDLSVSALAAGDRLQNMFLNLIDITRLEANTLPMALRPTPIAPLLRGMVKEREPLFRALDVHLILDLPRSSLVATVDEALLRRGLENLLDNASRFAKERVVVQAAEDDKAIAIEVMDDGPGVTNEKAAKIFDEFVTVGLPTERALGGSAVLHRGLGLTFVRLMARSHGGKASVRANPSGGSVFRIELPITA